MIWPKGTVAGVGVLLFVLSVQTVPLTQTVPEPALIPETGYVSDSRYVNAFFGFLLPLPQDADFEISRFHQKAIPTRFLVFKLSERV
jgi:hypothetical protein